MKRLLTFGICVLLATVGYAKLGSKWLQTASGNLTAAHTSSEVDTEDAVDIVIVLSVTTLTTADGDDEVDFYFQTTYDDGTTWTDLENIHFDNGDNGTTPTKIVRLGPWSPISTASNGAANTDGAISDDTKYDYPVGNAIRIKTSVTGATAPTYAFNAVAFLRN